jgi:hypothetical protein
MSETSPFYTGAATASAASAPERELCEQRRWEEAGHLVAEIARRLSDWLDPQLVPPREPSMSEMPGVFMGTTSSTASAPERGQWEGLNLQEAGHVVAEIARSIPDWFRLPPDVERHFQQACIEQLRGVRAIIDHQIAEVSRAGRRSTGARIPVE